MPNGFGRGGFGRGGGGFGFRGSSSPWPFVGLGRGDCRDAAISSAELLECLHRQVTFPIMLCLTEAAHMLEVCPTVECLWG